MAILLIAVVSVAALVVGTLTQLMILVWIALGLCLAGLALIVIRSVLRRQRAVPLPNADEDEDTDEGSDDSADSAATDVDGSVSDGGGLSAEDGEASDNTALSSTVDDTADDTDPAEYDSHIAGADVQPRADEEPRVDGAAGRRQLVTEAGRVTQDSSVAEDHSLAATLVADRDEELVRVVAGRRRYHLADCRLLGSRSAAEITRAEAADEGFTACTACCG